MKPKKPERSEAEDLFRARLQNIIAPKHPLVRLAHETDWGFFESAIEMVDAKISKMEPQISKKGWGGSRPNSGGRRPGSGRKKGTPNKVTAEIKQLAQQYGPEAIAELARLATKAESKAARVAIASASAVSL